jgi:hypothetical protein
MHVWHIDAHRTDVRTQIAMHAFFCLHGHVQKTDFIKGSKERTDRTEIPAPASLNKEDEHEKQTKNH